MITDTIVALSTPPGTSALAIVRVSGPAVKEIILKCISKSLPNNKEMIYASFRDISDNVIDSLMYSYFKGPETFSGEDTLELFPHGNMLIVKSILSTITSLDGVRLAEPGEFTRRAFEHGKIDLVQAESIGSLIHAKSTVQLENSQKLLNGKLSSKIHSLVESVIHLSAKMELDVDFAEEEADPDIDTWNLDLTHILKVIADLKAGYEKSISASQKPTVVFYGKPNAGKSSLINALLEENRLLVSSKPGTTRDYIETQLFLPEGEVTLIDTAGLGIAIDELDAESQERTLSLINKSEHKVFIMDGCTHNWENEIQTNSDASIIISTKSDLKGFNNPNNCIHVSSTNLNGIDSLKLRLSELLFEKDTHDEDVWMASERQLHSLHNAESAIQKTVEQLLFDPSPELLAFELKEARSAMESITGHISSDDILNSVFSSFCIGK
ncbi:MAG: tRNA uridine-5-carboxymethylaminomethyl(34) synthesis GTPase MnmE [Fibrobacterales bacterium]